MTILYFNCNEQFDSFVVALFITWHEWRLLSLRIDCPLLLLMWLLGRIVQVRHSLYVVEGALLSTCFNFEILCCAVLIINFPLLVKVIDRINLNKSRVLPALK